MTVNYLMASSDDGQLLMASSDDGQLPMILVMTVNYLMASRCQLHGF